MEIGIILGKYAIPALIVFIIMLKYFEKPEPDPHEGWDRGWLEHFERQYLYENGNRFFLENTEGRDQWVEASAAAIAAYPNYPHPGFKSGHGND